MKSHWCRMSGRRLRRYRLEGLWFAPTSDGGVLGRPGNEICTGNLRAQWALESSTSPPSSTAITATPRRRLFRL